MKYNQLNNAQFKEQVQNFKRELEKENKSDSYVEEHISHVNEFLSYAENKLITRIQDINQSLADIYVSYLEQQRSNQRRGGTLSTKTINKHKNSIRIFWRYLNEEQEKTQTLQLRQKRTTQKLPTVLTPEEIQQLYSICDESAIGYRDKAMLGIYFGCGLRKKEGLKLQVSDIDFGRGRIHVRKSKNNRERYVMMSPTSQKHIEEYVYNYRDFYLPQVHAYEELFIGERGQPITAPAIAKRIEALWQRVKDQYGSDKHIGCHTLRHSLGTQLYMSGMTIEMIALMLGHQTLDVTQLYIHSANQLKK